MQSILVKRPRARDLGIPFEGTPGKMNTITDVHGVEVGHTTLISGRGKLKVGNGPVRTGVTAILPRGKNAWGRVFAAWFSLNGNGEMTGTTWIEESGHLETPIMLTNTHSVGIVRDAVIEWQLKRDRLVQPWSLPVVGETYDGFLNDINGFHIKKNHVFEALDNARSGPVAEGNAGGGTGMICYEFKGGTGTASRRVGERTESYTVGVLVQANQGQRNQLQIAGIPIGKEITENSISAKENGSILIVIATDAPLLPHQLKRLARRASLGLARTGSIASNDSGDIFVAFSTANPHAAKASGTVKVKMLVNEGIDPVFEGVVQATEEAIINALVAAETMTGIDNHRVMAIPHDRLRQLMRAHNRLVEKGGK